MSLLLLLTACENVKTNITTNDIKAEKPATESKEATIASEEFNQFFENPEEYKYKTITLTGSMLGSPVLVDDLIEFEIFEDANNYKHSAKIIYSDTSITIDDSNYVAIVGTVVDTYETFESGEFITAPIIKASSIEITTYDKVVEPALAIKEVNQSLTQFNYEVTLERLEYAEEETRLYVTIKNNGTSNFSVYEFDVKAYQDTIEYEHQTNYLANYPSLEYDLAPGATTSGIITLPPLDSNKQLVIDILGSSNNYDEEFELFEYTID